MLVYFTQFYKFSITYLIFYRNRVIQIEIPENEESSHVIRLAHGLKTNLISYAESFIEATNKG